MKGKKKRERRRVTKDRPVAGINKKPTNRKGFEDEPKKKSDHLGRLVSERTTALKRSEKTLSLPGAAYRALVENALVGVYQTDLDGRRPLRERYLSSYARV